MPKFSVDTQALQRIAGELTSLRDRFDAMNGWDRGDVEYLGDSAVTSAFAHFTRNWDDKRKKVDGLLSDVANASRDAATRYQQADDTVRNATQKRGH